MPGEVRTLSLGDEARRATEYAMRISESLQQDREKALAELRETSEWRQTQTERGNGIISTVPKLVERRALDKHYSCWIMDIDPEQFTDSEQPPAEYPIEAVRAKLFGAARIVAEYLIAEKLRVFIRHKGRIDGIHCHQMEARWA